MECQLHTWHKEKNFFFCSVCGTTSAKQPHDYLDDTECDDVIKDSELEKKCRHVWECLRDRCHNRGKGKYQAYKCTLCGKFQRR